MKTDNYHCSDTPCADRCSAAAKPWLWLVAAMCLCTLPLHSQQRQRALMLGVGYASQLDTYISPEHYRGMELRFVADRAVTNDSQRLTKTFTSNLFLANTSTRAKNTTGWSALYEFAFGMHYTLHPAEGLTIALGGQADIFLGGLYNTSGGNNPAQLYTGLDVAPAARADYNFRLWNKKFRLEYTVTAPLLGMRFSPAYGQSYYEIFARRNYDHNICLTTPLNAPTLKHRLTLDIPIKSKALRVGYLGDYRQAHVNNLKFHHITHCLIIGYVY